MWHGIANMYKGPGIETKLRPEQRTPREELLLICVLLLALPIRLFYIDFIIHVPMTLNKYILGYFRVFLRMKMVEHQNIY